MNLLKSLLLVLAIGVCFTACSKGNNSNDVIDDNDGSSETVNSIIGSWELTSNSGWTAENGNKHTFTNIDLETIITFYSNHKYTTEEKDGSLWGPGTWTKSGNKITIEGTDTKTGETQIRNINILLLSYSTLIIESTWTEGNYSFYEKDILKRIE